MFHGWGETTVNSLWWVPIGLAAWFLVSLAVGLCLGPVLRRSAEAREALERQLPEADVHQEPPQDERQAPHGQGTGSYQAVRASIR